MGFSYSVYPSAASTPFTFGELDATGLQVRTNATSAVQTTPFLRVGTTGTLCINAAANQNVLVGQDNQNSALGVSSTVGQAIPASAVLFANSTSKGFLPPRMTTAQKNAISSPAAGLVVYDTDLGKLCLYDGGAWETVTSA